MAMDFSLRFRSGLQLQNSSTSATSRIGRSSTGWTRSKWWRLSGTGWTDSGKTTSWRSGAGSSRTRPRNRQVSGTSAILWFRTGSIWYRNSNSVTCHILHCHWRWPNFPYQWHLNLDLLRPLKKLAWTESLFLSSERNFNHDFCYVFNQNALEDKTDIWPSEDVLDQTVIFSREHSNKWNDKQISLIGSFIAWSWSAILWRWAANISTDSSGSIWQADNSEKNCMWRAQLSGWKCDLSLFQVTWGSSIFSIILWNSDSTLR